MIPQSTRKLLISEDWTKIYQSFKNAEFKSYDFDTIKRVMISYLQENYPEDFNDFIESSEFIALIDIISFLGQNLSFRIDLNARENFLETAQRRDSILRLAQLISYNPSRNIPSSGLLKITAISTTDNVFDANGVNLSDVTINWNDPNNGDWYQQFINILNNSLTTPFGKTDLNKVINGIQTELYKINTNNPDTPIYNFSKSINGTNMTFEVVPANFIEEDYIYEESPRPANLFSLIYKNDNQGSGSINTGFFCLFKQGTLSLANFNVSNPVPNEIIGINTPNINNTDVWLWQLNKSGNYDTLWTKVDATVGNNIIYNSINQSTRTIFSVTSRSDDQIDLNFADGIFGDLPQGEFRLFYRQSNGLSYIIKPEQLSGIVISVPYLNANFQPHTLSLTLSLQYTVSNSVGSESDESVKLKAPQSYYLQNRMITAEDYNIGPLNAGSDILKVKSLNRISSGISRYFDLKDVSGKYSNTNIFASDGILYKEYSQNVFDFSFVSRNQIFSVVKNNITGIVNDIRLKSFFYDKYDRPELSSLGLFWMEVNKTPGQSRGYFYNANGNYKVGQEYTDNNLQFVQPGSKIKFAAPEGKYFDKDNSLVSLSREQSLGFNAVDFVNSARGEYSYKTYYLKTMNILPLYTGNSQYSTQLGIRYGLNRDPDYAGLKYWVDQSLANNYTIDSADLLRSFFSSVVDIDYGRSLSNNKIYFSVTDVSSGFSPLYKDIPVTGKRFIWATVKQVILDGGGPLDDGTGPIILSERVPTSAIPVEIITKYPDTLEYAYENEIVNFCQNYKNFGLTINKITRTWDFILNSNLNLSDPFNINTQEDIQDQNLDASWLIAFVWNGKNYRVFSRILNYIFESEKQTAFYVDNTSINYDYVSNEIIKDKIFLLPINLNQELISIGETNEYQIDRPYIEFDGYVDNSKVLVSFYDYNNLGEIVNPNSFDDVVEGNYIYFKINNQGQYKLTRESVIELDNEDLVTDQMKIDGQLFYFTNPNINVIKYWSASLALLVYTNQYQAREGRSDINFQYVHNSGDQRRIDPSKSNLIDIYLLTNSYNNDYRSYITGLTNEEPISPTISSLEQNYSSYINNIKAVSDEIIFHPVQYKPLFGTKADLKLQATFKAVKSSNGLVNDNNLKNRILTLINSFFSIENWDFGQSFYFSELSTYVMNELTPDITNFIIVPKLDLPFGSMFEIGCLPNEILISAATIDDIEIIDVLTYIQLQNSDTVNV